MAGTAADTQKEGQPKQPKLFADEITVVKDVKRAKEIIKILESYPDHVWACDTEVADIDLKTQGPCGNGIVTCVSIFGGPDVDFGDGPGTALWVDNLGEAAGVLQEFKAWFENPKYKKVWHNYGFDRHVMDNEKIACQGFYADTMHMARLWDTSRDRAFGSGLGYGLDVLSDELVPDPRIVKTKMKDIFGVGRLRKDGTEGAVKDLPPIRELQENPKHRQKFIEYSAKDAVATWWVWHSLESKLKKQEWIVEGRKLGDMSEFYYMYLSAFGECLTDMEANGVRVDTVGHLKQAEVLARAERKKMEEIFLKWAAKYCADTKYMNIGSATQIGAFLFGHWEKNKQKETFREFDIDKDPEELKLEQQAAEAANPYVNYTSPDLKALLKERGLKLSGKKSELVERLMAYDSLPIPFQKMSPESLVDMCRSRGLSSDGELDELIDRLTVDSQFVQKMVTEHDKAEAAKLISKPKKKRTIRIESLGIAGIEPEDFTPAGTPQVSAAVLRKLSGSNLFEDEKDAVYGKLFQAFNTHNGGGREACQAIGALANCGQIDATITNFLVPLQTLVDKNSRVHCSLNLNTETGRLSSRRPNLQNQPALEKDQYKIRDAFVAEEGNTLIVADYGQLELRLLAHMTDCKSMLQAFKDGGCFHSRTAVGMYGHIKDAVDKGDVLLEWDYSKGQPDVPLVKDTYGSERRKAKTLNFSIAYGKTVHGLAADWGISTEEATETLEAWYRDRPEVREWQEQQRQMAKRQGYVRTIMGRRRLLHDANVRGPLQGRALRAAINTPVQGSAADVVMCAMINLWRSEVLKKLGWKLLLQVHDEVMLEGPKEHRDAAMKEVRHLMENPFDGFGLNPLNVFLDVDAKSEDSWYKAK